MSGDGTETHFVIQSHKIHILSGKSWPELIRL